jgi:hypothetical protein
MWSNLLLPRTRQTEKYVLIDDLSISTLPGFSANEVFPCEGPQGKRSEVVRVGLWQKVFYKQQKGSKKISFAERRTINDERFFYFIKGETHD